MNNTAISDKQEFFLRSAPELTAAAGQGLRRFKGTAYGGGIITDHFIWDNVIFDLSTVKAADRMPVLLDHDSQDIVGYTSSVRIGGRIEVEGFVADGEAGRKVASLADQGFPWQMSVRIMPDTVILLEANERMSVNGREVAGPAAVFKDSLIREVSFCALGADRDTEANVFNMKERKEARMDNKPSGGQDRDLAIQALNDERSQFKAECEALKTRQAQFAAENAELKGQVKALEFERRTLAESLDGARREAEGFRLSWEAARRAGREGVLAEDFRRLNMAFSPGDDSVKAILQAEDAVFEAFRKALEGVKPAAAPPAGAFEDVAGEAFEADRPAKSLSQLAKDKREKEARNNGD